MPICGSGKRRHPPATRSKKQVVASNTLEKLSFPYDMGVFLGDPPKTSGCSFGFTLFESINTGYPQKKQTHVLFDCRAVFDAQSLLRSGTLDTSSLGPGIRGSTNQAPSEFKLIYQMSQRQFHLQNGSFLIFNWEHQYMCSTSFSKLEDSDLMSLAPAKGMPYLHSDRCNLPGPENSGGTGVLRGGGDITLSQPDNTLSGFDVLPTAGDVRSPTSSGRTVLCWPPPGS